MFGRAVSDPCSASHIEYKEGPCQSLGVSQEWQHELNTGAQPPKSDTAQDSLQLYGFTLLTTSLSVDTQKKKRCARLVEMVCTPIARSCHVLWPCFDGSCDA